MAETARRPQRMLHVWPAIVGVVFAAALIVILYIGLAGADMPGEVLTAAAFVYLGSAALGHRAAAWPLFGATFVLIGVGIAVQPFSPSWAMVVIVAALVVYGLFRGRLHPTWGLPLQAVAMLLVIALVLLVPVLPAPWGAVLVGVGLLLHAGWDAHHLRTRRVVVSTMAEFCAALDTCLAIGVIVLALR
ncbi:hypothetical protein M2317_002442 [Microbacterium sp. ZKA21]|uniref:hypothetical protein n=1 Tax=Microbacterium sp. ZKA21 TaxID=3381694 RepID=UPI003D246D88